jgi:YVTN family beta-propeller protein
MVFNRHKNRSKGGCVARPFYSRGVLRGYCCFLALLIPVFRCRADESFLIAVSNERSGEVTLVDGANHQVVSTLPVGKRPRGIHASPDGRYLYVAVSGAPIQGPPKLDANGNPLPEDNDDEESDHSADGIVVIDVAARKFVKKMTVGSDPEEFAVSPDGERLYIANEDVATASVLNLTSGKIEQIVPVKKEPEGVVVSPDGRRVYITCETGGEVIVIDVASNKATAQFTVAGRPRTAAFLPNGSKAFVPSESFGKVHVVDTASFTTDSIIDLPTGSRPMGMAISRDGERLYVSSGRAGTILGINTGAVAVSQSIKVGPRPWGIVLSPDDKLLFVANGPSDDISIVDCERGAEIKRVNCGAGPWGVAVIPQRSPAR